MRSTLILFALLLGSITLHAQCEYERIGAGQSGIAAVDTQVVASMQPRCAACTVDGCVAWQMPDSFSGHFFLNSPDSTLVSVQLTTQCSLLIFDTCVVLPPDGVAGSMYVFEYIYFGNSQLTVCGTLGQDIVIHVKSFPSLTEELTTPYLDLTTCQVPTGIEQPLDTCTEFSYFDIVHCRHTSERNRDNLPSGLYWQWCGSWWNGKKVLVP